MNIMCNANDKKVIIEKVDFEKFFIFKIQIKIIQNLIIFHFILISLSPCRDPSSLSHLDQLVDSHI